MPVQPVPQSSALSPPRLLAIAVASGGLLLCGLYLIWLATLSRSGTSALHVAGVESFTQSFVAGSRPLLMSCLALAAVFFADPRVNPIPAALHFAFYSLGVGMSGARAALGVTSPNWTWIAGVFTALSYAALIRASQRFPRALGPEDFAPRTGRSPLLCAYDALLARLLSPWLVWPIGFLLGGLYLFVTLPPVFGYIRLGTVVVFTCSYLWRNCRLLSRAAAIERDPAKDPDHAEGRERASPDPLDLRRRATWVLRGAAVYLIVAIGAVLVRVASPAGGTPTWWWWTVMIARYASLGCFALAILGSVAASRGSLGSDTSGGAGTSSTE